MIRARNDEIERREREAKKKIVRMEDQEEMLAAAESIPASQGQQVPQHQEPQDGGGRRLAGEGAEGGGGGRGERRRRRRDPLTAWVCGCYNSDDYAGHVSDLRQFLRGIEFQHVSAGSSVGEENVNGSSRTVRKSSQFSHEMWGVQACETIAA